METSGDACVEGGLAWHSSDQLPQAPQWGAKEVNSDLRSQMLGGGTPACVQEASSGDHRLSKSLIRPFSGRWKKQRLEEGQNCVQSHTATELGPEPRASSLSAKPKAHSSQRVVREQRHELGEAKV